MCWRWSRQGSYLRKALRLSRYAIELQYDGTHYHGWQFQLNVTSVQQVLQESLSKILRDTIAVTGCGRTDTGVHASHYVANFSYSEDVSTDFLFRLNNLLPHDISVLSVYSVPENFNARFDAISRSYRYVIERVKNPFSKDHSYLFYRALNIDVMQKGCSIIKEHKEFGGILQKPFTKQDKHLRDNERFLGEKTAVN